MHFCYGKVKLQVRNSPSISEIVKTKRHDEPRFILKNENRIVEAPILNHAGLELIMLEKLVLRKPPFVKKCGKGYVFTDAVEEFKSKIKTYEKELIKCER